MNAVETLRTYLGWCPHYGHDTKMPAVAGERVEGDTGQQPQPLRSRNVVPSGFTALSAAILIATCFAGGEAWWPALVLGITAAGIIAMAARSEKRGLP